jgi:DNA-binding transcriptional regulator YiaG
MIRIDGEAVPDIDYNTLQSAMAVFVPLKPLPLTGNEVRFLRRHLGLSQQDLAGQLSVTRQCVINWEKTADQPTGMADPTEKMFRLYALRSQNVSSTQFEKAFDRIFAARRSVRRWRYRIRADERLTQRKILQEILSAA